MAGVIKTKTFLGSILNAEFKSVTSPPTKINVGTGTTDPSEDDTALQTKVLIYGGSYDKALQTNYPSVDTDKLYAETRARLGTTDANSNSLTEAGTLDASDNLKDRVEFSSVSKTNTDILIISIKTKTRNVLAT